MEPDCYLFRGDSYDTPADNKASWVYRMMLNSRWYFYFNNFRIFFNTGRCGKRGELDQIYQIVYSNQNLKLIEKCGGQIHLRGLDNLRSLNGQPVVLIGNHMSLLETAVFHSVIRGILDFTFVIKKQLLEIPFFKEIMIALEAIPVGRDNPRREDGGHTPTEQLEQQAIDAAKEVKRWGEPVKMPEMNAHDRRIIHMTLKDDPEVQTESEGEGAFKKVVISLKK